MCGIWGVVNKGANLSGSQIEEIVKKLFILSESRGKEASGLALIDNHAAHILKRNIEASKFIKTREFNELFQSCKEESGNDIVVAIGHSRLVTNGTEHNDSNNQPVCSSNVISVHNGIIVNSEELWNVNPDISKESEVDTEVFVKLCGKYRKYKKNPKAAVEQTYKEIKGMASTLTIFCDDNTLVGASNNGSLYYCENSDNELIIFASERLTLETLWKSNHFLKSLFSNEVIHQIRTGELICINFNKEDTRMPVINHSGNPPITKKWDGFNVTDNRISLYEIDYNKIKKIRRCTKCLLPETMPFIEYDKDGVCNYCRTYKKMAYRSHNELMAWAESQRRSDGANDSIVSFSGGRDSSFGLHYFVKELELKPVAYSYDWGMVTDLARRNQSRMCSQLGIELILISADIRKKRDNIRKNVSAWLKKPDIGMIPLFMAGDKHYFYYANKVRKQFGLDTILMASNPFEKTHFKSGFCNVKPEVLKNADNKRELEQLKIADVFKMGRHYMGEFLKNSAYINSSIPDTIKAALSYYVIPHNYFRLFNYIEWNENEINQVLINQYDWETASDTKSTWRIGDGTAPFYNYIYYCVCGFTENDTLRSNQIREGMISREKGLKLIEQDNQVRWDSMKWYFDILGLDMYDALKVINDIPRMY